MPKVKGMAALGNEALFKRFGCDKGVFLTRWGNASLFNFATPPFPDKVSQRVLMTAGSGLVRKIFGVFSWPLQGSCVTTPIDDRRFAIQASKESL